MNRKNSSILKKLLATASIASISLNSANVYAVDTWTTNGNEVHTSTPAEWKHAGGGVFIGSGDSLVYGVGSIIHFNSGSDVNFEDVNVSAGPGGALQIDDAKNYIINSITTGGGKSLSVVFNINDSSLDLKNSTNVSSVDFNNYNSKLIIDAGTIPATIQSTGGVNGIVDFSQAGGNLALTSEIGKTNPIDTISWANNTNLQLNGAHLGATNINGGGSKSTIQIVGDSTISGTVNDHAATTVDNGQTLTIEGIMNSTIDGPGSLLTGDGGCTFNNTIGATSTVNSINLVGSATFTDAVKATSLIYDAAATVDLNADFTGDINFNGIAGALNINHGTTIYGSIDNTVNGLGMIGLYEVTTTGNFGASNSLVTAFGGGLTIGGTIINGTIITSDNSALRLSNVAPTLSGSVGAAGGGTNTVSALNWGPGNAISALTIGGDTKIFATNLDGQHAASTLIINADTELNEATISNAATTISAGKTLTLVENTTYNSPISGDGNLVINPGNGNTATFNGTVNTANAINVGAWTFVATANITALSMAFTAAAGNINFSSGAVLSCGVDFAGNESTLTLNGATITGAVNSIGASAGTVSSSGTSTITGIIGGANALTAINVTGGTLTTGAASTVTTITLTNGGSFTAGAAVNSDTISIENGIFTSGGAIHAKDGNGPSAITFTDAGKLALGANTLTGTVDFNNTAATVTLGAAGSITGIVKSTTAANGTLHVTGAGATIGSDVGGGADTTALAAVNIDDGADLAIIGALRATAVALTGSGRLSATGVINANTISIGSSTLTPAGAIHARDGASASAITFTDAGKLALGANTLTGSVDFAGNESTLTLNGATITGAVDSIGASAGTVSSGGTSTITGIIGGTNALTAINVTGGTLTTGAASTVTAITLANGGSFTAGAAVNSDTISIENGTFTSGGAIHAKDGNGPSAITFTGAGKLALGVNTLAGTVDFNNTAATVTLGAAGRITGIVQSTTAANGTLHVTGDGVTIGSGVGGGADTTALAAVNIDDGAGLNITGTVRATAIALTGNGKLSATGVINANTISIGSSTLTPAGAIHARDGASASAITFTDAGKLALGANTLTGSVDFAGNESTLTLNGATITGAVNSIGVSAGTVSSSGTSTITGIIGGTNALTAINVTGGTLTTGAASSATSITLSGGGGFVAGGNIAATTLTLSDTASNVVIGTFTFTGNIVAGSDGVGTVTVGTGSVVGNIGSNTASINVLNLGAGNSLTISSNVFAKTINAGGTSLKISSDSFANIIGSSDININFNPSANTFHAGISTSGAITFSQAGTIDRSYTGGSYNIESNITIAKGAVFGSGTKLNITSGNSLTVSALSDTNIAEVSGAGSVLFTIGGAMPSIGDASNPITQVTLSGTEAPSVVTGDVNATSVNVSSGATYQVASKSKVSGNMTFADGATLDLGSNSMSSSGTVAFSGNLIFKTKLLSDGTGGNISANTLSLNDSSTITLVLDTTDLGVNSQSFTIFSGAKGAPTVNISSAGLYQFKYVGDTGVVSTSAPDVVSNAITENLPSGAIATQLAGIDISKQTGDMSVLLNAIATSAPEVAEAIATSAFTTSSQSVEASTITSSNLISAIDVQMAPSFADTSTSSGGSSASSSSTSETTSGSSVSGSDAGGSSSSGGGSSGGGSSGVGGGSSEAGSSSGGSSGSSTGIGSTSGGTAGSTSTNKDARTVAPSSGEEHHARKRGVWVKGFATQVLQTMKSKSSGSRSITSGMSMGVDTQINDAMTVGIAGTFSEGNVRMKDKASGNRIYSKSWMFSGYSMYELPRHFFVRGSILAGNSNVTSMSKQVVSKTKSTISYANYSTHSFTLDGSLTYRHMFKSRIMLTPTVGMNMSFNNGEGYEDKGGSYSRRLHKKSGSSFKGYFGAALSTGIDLGHSKLSASINSKITHQYAGRLPMTKAQISGQYGIISTKPSAPIKNMYSTGIDLSLRNHDGEIGIGFDRGVASHYRSHGGTLKLKLNF